MIRMLGGLAQLAGHALTALGEALEVGTFDDHAAGAFLATGALLGRFESDGPDAAATISAAGVAAEPGSAPVELAPQAPGADPYGDLAVLLWTAASYIDRLAPAGHRAAFADPLIAGLRDLAAQFDADEQPTT